MYGYLSAHLMDLPAQVSLILAACSLPIRLLGIVSDAKDPLSSAWAELITSLLLLLWFIIQRN